MRIDLFTDLADTEVSSFLETDTRDLVSLVGSSRQSNMDAHDLLKWALDFQSEDAALIVLGYMLGKGTRFYVDCRGLHLEIRRLPQLLEVFRMLKSADSSDAQDLGEE